jgi:hypothetical protein
MTLALRVRTSATRGIAYPMVVVTIILVGPAWGAPLVLEAEVALGEVRGRIDHLAVGVAWSPGWLLANYPMSLDQARRRVHVVFRHPATLVAFDAQCGMKLFSIKTCADWSNVRRIKRGARAQPQESFAVAL